VPSLESAMRAEIAGIRQTLAQRAAPRMYLNSRLCERDPASVWEPHAW
jgi:hypothetical protein